MYLPPKQEICFCSTDEMYGISQMSIAFSVLMLVWRLSQHEV